MAVDLVPQMTGETTDGVTVTANSIISSYYPWQAFDNSDSTIWATARGGLPNVWLMVDFGEQKTVKAYSLTSRNSNVNDNPASWELQGSNDYTIWDVLDSQNNVRDWGLSELRNFNCENVGSYRYYRFYVATNQGGESVTIAEAELYDEEVPISIVPNMTANNVPSPYVASVNFPVYQTRDAYRAFNFSLGSGKSSLLAASGYPTGILTIDLGENNAHILKSYKLFAYQEASYLSRTPKNWTIEGSNNNTDWVELDTQSGIGNWDKNTPKNFVIADTTSYRYYRLNVTANNGDANHWGLGFWDLLGSKPGGEPEPPVSEGIFFATFI